MFAVIESKDSPRSCWKNIMVFPQTYWYSEYDFDDCGNLWYDFQKGRGCLKMCPLFELTEGALSRRR